MGEQLGWVGAIGVTGVGATSLAQTITLDRGKGKTNNNHRVVAATRITRTTAAVTRVPTIRPSAHRTKNSDKHHTRWIRTTRDSVHKCIFAFKPSFSIRY
ncbi:unnamed protein product [Leptidea sinapis]|uniref:Uncharacterized protein n=1 Tax=Leptidea sinapis TaxID=189913 RepID=A0A5E4QS03_9NEOP|nr:unnamed protein product [Leptidea sinapis]